MFTFVVAICLRIYAATVHSWHLSAHSVIPVIWVYVLAWQISTYHIGDWVFLDARDIKTTHPSPKLAHRYLGPYVIQWRVGRNAYRLKLPTSMTYIHPVFNVVKLLLVPDDPIPGRWMRPPPPPEIVDGDEHYVVEQIADSRLIRGRLHFLIK